MSRLILAAPWREYGLKIVREWREDGVAYGVPEEEPNTFGGSFVSWYEQGGSTVISEGMKKLLDKRLLESDGFTADDIVATVD